MREIARRSAFSWPGQSGADVGVWHGGLPSCRLPKKILIPLLIHLPAADLLLAAGACFAGTLKVDVEGMDAKFKQSQARLFILSFLGGAFRT